ncbi:MAG: branched-chain amino acid aminotransferase [Candidatus Heimdallarchaeota archaeon]|nr:branched-chain amino acid aminotransferase [Candidatus Heimdallarchaeota archaeon]
MEIIQTPNIEIEELTEFKVKPFDDELKFGREFTDRMFLRKYKDGAWHTGKISPYQNFSLPPSTMVFHYGQEIFEGLKAFTQVDGTAVIFRPDENAKRFKKSAERMVMPPIDPDYFLESTRMLVELEKDWIPKKRGTALYIRPTLIATEPALGVHPSDEYYFFTILSPSGPYFPEGFAPTSIKVEDKYVRASQGGTGEAKAGGNYAASLLAATKAKEEGFSQVLWLDAVERKYVEEVGAMNIAFVIDDVIYTAPLNGTILPGITRKSVIQLSSDMGIQLKEERLAVDTLIEGIKSGNVTEIFGIGTAASIAPVGKIKYKDEVLLINNKEIGPVTQSIYDELTGIQYGEIEDRHGWNLTIGK